jgi:cold shock CspA family protein
MSGNVQSQMIPRQTGRVKWFNTSSGFGFITLCTDTESPIESKDIFVHFSSIYAKDSSQYKYLVQGEYVDFELAKPAKGAHEFHAVNVTGVKGGELMCETIKPNVQPFVRRVPTTKPFVMDEDDGFIPVAHRHRIKDKREQPSGKREQPSDKREQPSGKREQPSGKREQPSDKREQPSDKRPSSHRKSEKA